MASEAKMDAQICTATVKDGDKGFYITLRSCLKPMQKHTIHSEWTDHYFQADNPAICGWVKKPEPVPYSDLNVNYDRIQHIEKYDNNYS